MGLPCGGSDLRGRHPHRAAEALRPPSAFRLKLPGMMYLFLPAATISGITDSSFPCGIGQRNVLGPTAAGMRYQAQGPPCRAGGTEREWDSPLRQGAAPSGRSPREKPVMGPPAAMGCRPLTLPGGASAPPDPRICDPLQHERGGTFDREKQSPKDTVHSPA